MGSLEDVKFVINTNIPEEDEDDDTYEWQEDVVIECRQLFQTGLLGEILASAPDLHKLAIEFDRQDPCCPINIQHIVLSTHWQNLRKVSFDSIDTAEESWVVFFERHASSIRHICLRNIRLTDGTWPDVLEHMQTVLDLECAEFGDFLLGYDPNQMWRLNPVGCVSSKDDSCQNNRTRWALEEFMVDTSI